MYPIQHFNAQTCILEPFARSNIDFCLFPFQNFILKPFVKCASLVKKYVSKRKEIGSLHKRIQIMIFIKIGNGYVRN